MDRDFARTYSEDRSSLYVNQNAGWDRDQIRRNDDRWSSMNRRSSGLESHSQDSGVSFYGDQNSPHKDRNSPLYSRHRGGSTDSPSSDQTPAATGAGYSYSSGQNSSRVQRSQGYSLPRQNVQSSRPTSQTTQDVPFSRRPLARETPPFERNSSYEQNVQQSLSGYIPSNPTPRNHPDEDTFHTPDRESVRPAGNFQYHDNPTNFAQSRSAPNFAYPPPNMSGSQFRHHDRKESSFRNLSRDEHFSRESSHDYPNVNESPHRFQHSENNDSVSRNCDESNYSDRSTIPLNNYRRTSQSSLFSSEYNSGRETNFHNSGGLVRNIPTHNPNQRLDDVAGNHQNLTREVQKNMNSSPMTIMDSYTDRKARNSGPINHVSSSNAKESDSRTRGCSQEEVAGFPTNDPDSDIDDEMTLDQDEELNSSSLEVEDVDMRSRPSKDADLREDFLYKDIDMRDFLRSDVDTRQNQPRTDVNTMDFGCKDIDMRVELSKNACETDRPDREQENLSDGEDSSDDGRSSDVDSIHTRGSTSRGKQDVSFQRNFKALRDMNLIVSGEKDSDICSRLEDSSFKENIQRSISRFPPNLDSTPPPVPFADKSVSSGTTSGNVMPICPPLQPPPLPPVSFDSFPSLFGDSLNTSGNTSLKPRISVPTSGDNSFVKSSAPVVGSSSGIVKDSQDQHSVVSRERDFETRPRIDSLRLEGTTQKLNDHMTARLDSASSAVPLSGTSVPSSTPPSNVMAVCPPPPPPPLLPPPQQRFNPPPAVNIASIDFSKPPPNFANAFPPRPSFGSSQPTFHPSFFSRPPPVPDFSPYSTNLCPPPSMLNMTQPPPRLPPLRQPHQHLPPSTQYSNPSQSPATSVESTVSFPSAAQSNVNPTPLTPTTTSQNLVTTYSSSPSGTTPEEAIETVNTSNSGFETDPDETVTNGKEEPKSEGAAEEDSSAVVDPQPAVEPEVVSPAQKTVLLGKLQAKKRLLSFSMAKQGGGAAKTNVKVAKPPPAETTAKESEEDEKKELIKKKRKKEEKKILAIEEIMREEEKLKIAAGVARSALPPAFRGETTPTEGTTPKEVNSEKQGEDAKDKTKSDDKGSKSSPDDDGEAEARKKSEKNKEYGKDSKINKYKDKYEKKDTDRQNDRGRRDDKYRRDYGSKKYYDDDRRGRKENSSYDYDDDDSRTSSRSSMKRKDKRRRSPSWD